MTFVNVKPTLQCAAPSALACQLYSTSISLSERDVDFHLRQAEICHGLLRQGFKKADIVRYLTDYRKAAAEAAGKSVDSAGLSIPSTLELALRPRRRSSQVGLTEHPVQTSNAGSVEREAPVPEDEEDGLSRPEVPGRKPDLAHDEEDPDQDSVSPVSMAPVMHVNKHAPRKSSLLRFAKAASQDSSPAGYDEGAIQPVLTASPRLRGYRRRSHTYPYRSSDPESGPRSSAQDGLLDGMSRISLRTSPKESDTIAQESEDMPFALPSPLSSTSRADPLPDDTFASPITTPTLEDSYAGSTPAPLRRRRRSSLLSHSASIPDMPSSPPLPTTPLRDGHGLLPVSPGFSQLPTTPTPIRNADEMSRTEPRRYTHLYLDGNSFSVYNDSLPGSSQPQTPADLSRRPLITEYEAAYTAPPGMVRQWSASFSYNGLSGFSREAGEQSPTARAMNLRERRNRELLRSVRAEGVRLRRLRLRDEAMLTQRAFEANQAEGTPRAELVPHMSEDFWRDDLDADRVGEENFDDGGVNPTRVMRVVSGNARFEI